MSGIAAEIRTLIAVGRCLGRTISPAKAMVTGTGTNTAKVIITATTAPRRLAAPTERFDMRTEHGRAVLMLQRDQEAMNWWYPQFRLVIPMIGPTHWRGRIKPFRTRLATFEVVVVYRSPAHSIPQVWVVEPEISRRTHYFHPHLHAGGSICSFFPPDGTYTPEREDISRLVDLVSDWLRRHIYFEENGRWPGPEAPHNPHDVLSAMSRRPDARCICGRKLPFRLCCKRRYERLAVTTRTASRPPAKERSERLRLEQLMRMVRRNVGHLAFGAASPNLGPPTWLLTRQSGSIPAMREVSHRGAEFDRQASDVGCAPDWAHLDHAMVPLSSDLVIA